MAELLVQRLRHIAYHPISLSSLVAPENGQFGSASA
jgi:hypothetical protein